MVTHFGLGKTPAFGWQRRGNDGRKLYECDPAGALMTVYVDAARIPANVPNGGRVVRGTWSHMTADTRAELDAMADRIGLKRQWIQYPGTPKEHYDVTESRRAAAVAAGAVEVDTAFTVAVVKRKAIAYAGAAPSSFVAIDFETCMAKRASPIQIGVVRVYEGQIGRKNTSPVLPPEKFRRFEAHAKKIHKLEKDGGVWFARGGTNRLVQGMATHFERLGGTLRLGDAVTRIETYGDKATAVHTASGWRGEADAIASNADLMHSYRDLLGQHPRGQKQGEKLAAKRWSPSLFVLHFGIKGSWPGIPHHMILFGPRYEGLLTDIYDHGVLPQDFSLYLHHPTVTDPSMAPDGHSTFYALAPVPHMGKLPIDWDRFAPVYAERILDEIQHRLIPDIRSRIVTQFHYTPRDFGRDLAAHMGSAFSLEPLLTQSAWFRAHNRDDVIPNLYLVGAGTHPGAGIPGVVGSAKATAALMLDDLGRM